MSTGPVFLRRTICNRVRHAVFIAVAGIACPGWAAVERAPAARVVEVTPPVCGNGAFQAVAFLDSLRVELAGRGLACCTLAEPGGEGGDAGALRVTLELVPCAADAEQILASVRDPSDGRVVAREISFSDVAETARPRALALAVAELIRTLGHPPEKQTPPPPAAVVSSAPPPPPSPTRTARLSLALEGEARVLPARSTTVWGGRARVTVPWRSLHADLDVGGGYASAASDLGDVVLRAASLGVGFGPRLATRAAVIDLGLRAELGWAWIRGHALSADVHSGSGSGLISSAGLRAAAALPAALRIRPCLALEGGAILQGVNGQSSGRAVVGMTGYYLLAALGIGVLP
jgi:hypothetical protein